MPPTNEHVEVKIHTSMKSQPILRRTKLLVPFLSAISLILLYALLQQSQVVTIERFIVIGICIALPISILFIETCNCSNTMMQRCTTGSFLLAIVMTQCPTILSSFITSCILTIGGLLARPLQKPMLNSTQQSSPNISPLERGSSRYGDTDRERRKPIPQSYEDSKSTQIYNHEDLKAIHDSWWKRIPPKARGIFAALLLVIILINENFFIWFVSSAYKPSHGPPYPEALQDNGRDFLLFIQTKCNFTMKDIQWARDTLNVQWSLVSSSCTVLLLLDLGWAVFEGHKKTIWSMGARVVLTLGLSRLIRTLAFTLTVLPSQMPNCYIRRFPLPVPEFGSWEWFKEGWVPRSKGGCNDLIISGHAVITSGFGCLITDALSPAKRYKGKRLASTGQRKGLFFGNGCASSWAVWMLVAVDYSIEVFQGFHYSIDMLLGMIITRLVFSVLADFGCCDEEEIDEIMRVKRRPTSFATLALETKASDDEGHGKQNDSFKMGQSTFSKDVSMVDWAKYSLPPLVAFTWMNFTKVNPNYAIFMYSSLAIVSYSKKDEEHSKFLIFCVLYIALTLYL